MPNILVNQTYKTHYNRSQIYVKKKRLNQININKHRRFVTNFSFKLSQEPMKNEIKSNEDFGLLDTGQPVI